MANLSELNTVVTDMFGVLGTIISGMVDLLTGDLLVLTVVGAFVALIVGIIALLFTYLKKTFSNSVPSTKMRK